MSMDTKKKTAIVSILLNVLLTVFKYIAYLFTASLAILGETYHSFSDILTSILVYISLKKSKDKNKSKMPLENKISLAIGILIFLLTMVPVNVLARSQADGDELNLPEVRIHYNTAFPAQMQSGTSDLEGFLDGRLITTNNGIVYVQKLFKLPEGTDYRNIAVTPATVAVSIVEVEIEGVVGEYKVYRLVYAIPEDSITGIIYYSEK